LPFSLLYSRFSGKIIVVLFLIFSFPEKNDVHIRQQKRKPMHRSAAWRVSGVIFFLAATENSQSFFLSVGGDEGNSWAIFSRFPYF
jgi:hypothetical protein